MKGWGTTGMKRVYITTIVTALLVVAVFSLVYSVWDGSTRLDVLKVGFIYENDESTPYTYNFMLAQEALEASLPGRVRVYTHTNVPEDESANALHALVQDGCSIIFTNNYSDQIVEAAHQENTSIIRYSDENSMACVLAIAYYYAHGDYIFHREYQTGRGFADLVLIPRKNVDTPAIIVELKYTGTTGTALDQIHDRHYPDKVKEYAGDILLVAVTYDRKTKEHRCEIEAMKL